MSYEQENHKIRKIWEQSQKNANDLNQKQNRGFILPGNSNIIIPKLIQSQPWQTVIPYYLETSGANILHPFDGQLTCIWNYEGKFEFDSELIEFNINGLIKRVIATPPLLYPTHVEGRVDRVIDLPTEGINDGDIYEVTSDDDPYNNGYYTWIEFEERWDGPSSAIYGNPTWTWDTEISNLITYDGSYTIKARPFTGRWGKYGPSITFSTYPEYPPPPQPSSFLLANFQGNASIVHYDGPRNWSGSHAWYRHDKWYPLPPPGHWGGDIYHPQYCTFPSACPGAWFRTDPNKCETTLIQGQIEKDCDASVGPYVDEWVYASMGGGFYLSDKLYAGMGFFVEGLHIGPSARFKVMVSSDCFVAVEVFQQGRYGMSSIFYCEGGGSYESGWQPFLDDPFASGDCKTNISITGPGTVSYIKVITSGITEMDYDGIVFTN
jgi:hypothetical protein